MTECADFDRNTEKMEELLVEVKDFCDNFSDRAIISDKKETWQLFRLYDMLLTQRSTLSAMICSAKAHGTRGSAVVDRLPQKNCKSDTAFRIITQGDVSNISAVSPIPNPELWFETLLSRQTKTEEK